MVKKILLLSSLLLINCVSQYGFLKGTNYQFQPPYNYIDLNKLPINYTIVDQRQHSNKILCSDIEYERNSELDSNLGLVLFSTYIYSLTEYCNGYIDTLAQNPINITLEAVNPKIIGFGRITVHGLVQFRVSYNDFYGIYSSDMKDGDIDSPLGKNSFATRKTALRKMVVGSCRRAIENFLIDLNINYNKENNNFFEAYIKGQNNNYFLKYPKNYILQNRNYTPKQPQLILNIDNENFIEIQNYEDERKYESINEIYKNYISSEETLNIKLENQNNLKINLKKYNIDNQLHIISAFIKLDQEINELRFFSKSENIDVEYFKQFLLIAESLREAKEYTIHKLNQI